MKKRIVLVFAFTLILAISAPVFAADNAASSAPVTISFEKGGRYYEMTFTNVADSVVTAASDGQTCPYMIFYYPGATVSVTESLDNTDDFTNGFFLEANYHFGVDGKVKADTDYVIEDVFEKLFKILNGSDADLSGATGTLGLGPVFLTPWSSDVFSQYDTDTLASIQTFAKDSVSSGISSDSPSSWAAEQVNAAISAGIVPENLRGNYTSSVSRGDVAEMFIRLIEESTGQDIEAFMAEKGVQIDTGAFTDTTDENVLAANALGIISGVGNNRFDPDGTFTRAQIAAILNRLAGVLGVETEGYSHSFTDVAGHWSDDELGWPVHAGIISGVGDNHFDPDGPLTTEQAIAIAWRALKALS